MEFSCEEEQILRRLSINFILFCMNMEIATNFEAVELG